MGEAGLVARQAGGGSVDGGGTYAEGDTWIVSFRGIHRLAGLDRDLKF